jgi:toxin ParE1/3/4
MAGSFGYSLTSLARSDLFEIWSYIAKDSTFFADRVEDEIFKACELLSKSPSIGHSRPDLTSRKVLFWNVPRYPNYLIVYRPGTNPIEIVAIWHAKRSLRLLSGR